MIRTANKFFSVLIIFVMLFSTGVNAIPVATAQSLSASKAEASAPVAAADAPATADASSEQQLLAPPAEAAPSEAMPVQNLEEAQPAADLTDPLSANQGNDSAQLPAPAVEIVSKGQAEPEATMAPDPQVTPQATLVPDLTAAAVTIEPTQPIIQRIIQPVVPTLTYNFFVGSTQVDSQTIKNGESLIQPADPNLGVCQQFTGWVIDGTTTQVSFDTAITFTESNTIKVVPSFKSVCYVYFNLEGNVVATKEVTPGSATNGSNIPMTIPSGKAFLYWSATAGGSEFNFSTPISANTTLYAVLTDKHKISFDTKGGTTQLPVYVNSGGTLASQSVPNPSKAGYTFKHWSKTDGGTAYNASAAITSDLLLYAVWTAKTDTAYTVITMLENAEDSGYSYKESLQKTGTTDATVTFTNPSYSGFTYEKREPASATIAGDGSTIVKVYFKRVTYTLTMYKLSNNNNATLVLGPQSIKNGASTAPWWNPVASANPTLNWSEQSDGSGPWYSLAPVIDGKNLVIYGKNQGSTNYVFFYLENNAAHTEVNPPFYFTGKSGLYSTKEDYVSFPGFEVIKPNSAWNENPVYNEATGKYEWKIYYNRLSYIISFNKNDGTGTANTSPIPYQTDISGQALAGYVANSTTKVINGVTYLFAGWFDNAALAGSAYSFAGKTMPANNLILYAKWVPPTHTVRVHTLPGSGGTVSAFTVNHNALFAKATADAVLQTPAGMNYPADFLGWHWFVNGTFAKFDFSMQIATDVELYPVWKDQIFHVTYDSNGGTGTVADATNYVLNSYATVLSGSGLTPPVGMVFLGWKQAAITRAPGDLYKAGDKVLMEGNVTLQAQWGPINSPTQISYDPNGGSGSPKVVALANNATHTVEANTFTRTGYYFTGWNTQANGGGTAYQPGAQVMVDRIDASTNTLYAQWKLNSVDIIGYKKWVDGKNSDHVAVSMKLFRKVGTGAAAEVTGFTPSISPASGFSSTFTYTWSGVPELDENNQPYIYTIDEAQIPSHYLKNISEDGRTVTNSYVPQQGNITASKVWVGGVKVPVNFQLVQTIEGGSATDYLSPVALDGTADTCPMSQGCEFEPWKVKWTGMPSTTQDGKAINYTVKEVNLPANFVVSYSNDGRTVTNTYQSPTPDITAKKLWVNGPLADHVAVTLKVYQDGNLLPSTAYTVTVNPSSGTAAEFTYTIKGLPQYKTDGVTLYKYTVDEDPVSNYVKSISQDGLTLTNSYKSPTMAVTAEKKWMPANLSSHLKNPVSFQLYRYTTDISQAAAVGSAVSLNATGNWQYTWPTVDQYNASGASYTYFVRESPVPNNFTADKVDDLVVTNTYKSPLGSFTATKIWQGDATVTRPTMVFTLWRLVDTVTPSTDEQVDVPTKEVNGTTTTATWSDLPQTNPAGYPYKYYVKETFKTAAASNANWTLGEFNFRDKTITNTVAAKSGQLQIKKVLVNEVPAPKNLLQRLFGLAATPISFTVVLTDEYNNEISTTIQAGQTITVEGLYYGNYTIEETVTNGYTPTYSPASLTLVKGEAVPLFTVTNTNNGADNVVSKTISKTWVNGPKPDVSLELWRKGVNLDESLIDEKMGSFTATAAKLTETFNGLAKHDPSGREFEYYVKEVDSEGNAIAAGAMLGDYQVSYGADGLSVTNTYVVPTTGQAGATKVWKDGPATHPTVWFKLYRNIAGGAVEEVPVAQAPIKELTNGTTSALWTGLETTDADGNAYTFTVKEVNANGVDWKPDNYDKSESGLTVTNTYVIPTGSFSATKNWSGAVSVTRPTMVFTLYRKADAGTDASQPAIDELVPGAGAQDLLASNDTASVNWTGLATTTLDGRPYTFYVKEAFKDTSAPTNANWVMGTYDAQTKSITNTVIGTPTGKLTILKIFKNGVASAPAERSSLLRAPAEVTSADLTFAATITGPYGYSENVTLSTTTPVVLEGLYYGVYTVTETAGDYTATYDPGQSVTLSPTSAEQTVTVTNTPTQAATSVKVTKTWQNGPARSAGDVSFTLYRKSSVMTENEVVIAVPVATQTSDHEFVYTWSDLEAYDSNGKVYTFTVEENVKVENYTSGTISGNQTDGFTVTNTYVIPTGSFSATKVWEVEDETVTIPAMQFILQRRLTSETSPVDVEGFDPIEVNEDNTEATWNTLPLTDIHGVEYVYSVREVFVSELPTNDNWVLGSYDGDTKSITNSVIETPNGKLTIKKYFNNQHNNQPALAKFFNFLRSPLGTPAQDLTFKATVTGPYGFVKEVTLSTTEDVVLEGLYYGVYKVTEAEGDYHTSYVPGQSITLSSESPEATINVFNSTEADTSVTVTKIWENGPARLAGDVTFTLYRTISGSEDKATVSADPVATETSDHQFVYTWSGLETYDKDGKAYIYSVEETVNVLNYDAGEVTGDQNEGFTVTNTYVIPTDGSFSAIKVWEGGYDTDHIAVPLTLWRMIEGGEMEEVTDIMPVISPDPAENPTNAIYTYTWSKLETTDIDGKPYTYYVSEEPYKWYTPTYEPLVEIGEGQYCGKGDEGCIIINSAPALSSATQTGSKEWNGGPSEKPAIWLQLMQSENNAAAIPFGAPVKLDGLADEGCTSGCEKTAWQAVWLNMPVSDNMEKTWTYYVKEVNSDGADWVPANYKKAETGMTVTNTFIPPTLIDPPVAFKKWENFSGPYPTVWMQLYRHIDGGAAQAVGSPVPLDGTAGGDCAVGCEVVAWSARWDNLPAMDFSGNLYTYSVKETNAAGADWVPEGFAKTEAGMTVTNRYETPAPQPTPVTPTPKPIVSIPYTGDSSNITAYGLVSLMALLAFAGMQGLALKRRKH
ncbi:MAG: Cna B-type domain-containing protein [Anaerolineaceae bacterium]|nr:Cna B-type domain-containing protein [Anaerolineaceae bacterium]